MKGVGVLSTAIISADGRYRYSLTRRLGLLGGERNVVVIMLNPSTADADQDDSTIRRLIGFAKRWGNGVLNVVNLYAYRSTDRGALINVSDPVGPDNDHWIGATVATADLVVLAWGNDGAGPRARHVYEMVRAMNPMRIGPLTKAGEPKHPLYIPYGTPLESMKDYGEILDQT